MLLVHIQINPFWCFPDCGFVAASPSGLLSHFSNKHGRHHGPKFKLAFMATAPGFVGVLRHLWTMEESTIKMKKNKKAKLSL